MDWRADGGGRTVAVVGSTDGGAPHARGAIMRPPGREADRRADGGRAGGAGGSAHGCDSARRSGGAGGAGNRGIADDCGGGTDSGGAGGPGEGDGADGDGIARAVRVLIAFAGDDTARSTLALELRRRGAEVTAIDTRIGGRDHDLTHPEVAAELLRRVREGHFDADFAAPPCAYFSVAHTPQLRSRAEPKGVQPTPARWRRYMEKHNALAAFTAELIVAAQSAG
eukprot:5839201-Pleurochrysis_carterae.AAC.1